MSLIYIFRSFSWLHSLIRRCHRIIQTCIIYIWMSIVMSTTIFSTKLLLFFFLRIQCFSRCILMLLLEDIVDAHVMLFFSLSNINSIHLRPISVSCHDVFQNARHSISFKKKVDCNNSWQMVCFGVSFHFSFSLVMVYSYLLFKKVK